MVLLALGLAAGTPRAQQDKQNPPLRYESAKTGLQFEYPAGFVVGRFDASTDRSGFFAPSIVLVEKSRLGGQDPKNLRIGTVAVLIIPLSKKDSKDWKLIGSVNPHIWKEAKEGPKEVKIGPHQAIKLPGFPGPFGENTYVYLLTRPDGRMVIFKAHNRFLDNDRTPTGYDKTIEKIIKTVSFHR